MMKKWLALVACLMVTAGANFAHGQQTPQWRATSFKGMTVVTPCIWQLGPKDQTYFGAGEVPEQVYDLSVLTSYRITDTADAADTAARPLYWMMKIMGDTVTLNQERYLSGTFADSVNNRIEGKEFSAVFDLMGPKAKLCYRVYRYEPLKRQWEILVIYMDETEEQMVADRIFESIRFDKDAFLENEPLGNND